LIKERRESLSRKEGRVEQGKKGMLIKEKGRVDQGKKGELIKERKES